MKASQVQVTGTNKSAGMPGNYFQDVLRAKQPHTRVFGTGLVFLPQYQYEAVLCMEVLTKFIRQEGLELVEFHDIPVGRPARYDLTEPGESYITQVFIKADLNEELFEEKLLMVRKLAEQQIRRSKLKHRHSFSLGTLSTCQ
jgi:glutamate synthase (NADPH/NADH) large chain